MAAWSRSSVVAAVAARRRRGCGGRVGRDGRDLVGRGVGAERRAALPDRRELHPVLLRVEAAEGDADGRREAVDYLGRQAVRHV